MERLPRDPAEPPPEAPDATPPSPVPPPGPGDRRGPDTASRLVLVAVALTVGLFFVALAFTLASAGADLSPLVYGLVVIFYVFGTLAMLKREQPPPRLGGSLPPGQPQPGHLQPGPPVPVPVGRRVLRGGAGSLIGGVVGGVVGYVVGFFVVILLGSISHTGGGLGSGWGYALVVLAGVALGAYIGAAIGLAVGWARPGRR